MTIVTQQTGQFDGYDLDDLRGLVFRMLRVTNTSRYSSDGGISTYDWIDDGLNRGQEEFVRQTHCLRTYAIVELKANYRTYRLPWDFLDFMAAYYYDGSLTNGYKELIVTTIETLNHEISGWRTKTDTPERIYIDRIYGNNWMFGLYPIPDADGDTITFNSDYGVVTQWVCPLYTYNSEYGVVIRMTDTDEFFLNTDSGTVGKIQTMNKNVTFEYYRLPQKLLETTLILGGEGTQRPEIPREYQKALAYYATADLLMNNPEDSVEMKRHQAFMQRFQGEVISYVKRRSKPLSGLNLRATSAYWPSLDSMDFYSKGP